MKTEGEVLASLVEGDSLGRTRLILGYDAERISVDGLQSKVGVREPVLLGEDAGDVLLLTFMNGRKLGLLFSWVERELVWCVRTHRAILHARTGGLTNS